MFVILFLNIVLEKVVANTLHGTTSDRNTHRSHFSMISTVEEWEAALLACKSDNVPIVLQVGAEWCEHCGPVKNAIASLQEKYDFKHIHTDAADSELVDHFKCTKLPTLVFFNHTMETPSMVQSVRTSTVESHIQKYTKPKLVLNDDF